MEITYSSNNSGGHWWLSDEDWKELERAGWWVEWGGVCFCDSKVFPVPEGKERCESPDNCPGHRMADSAEEAELVRYMGALAHKAMKDFATVRDALWEFEQVTGKSVTVEGCPCCGAPHEFSWGSQGDCGYCSGESCEWFM